MKNIICIKCFNEMRLDDVDFTSKVNKDYYYVCDNCNTSCIAYIRFGKCVDLSWFESEKN